MTARTTSSDTCQNFCGSERRKRVGSIVVKVSPALLIRMCGSPKRSRAIARMRSHSAGRRRSAMIGRICPVKVAPPVAASISTTSASMWPTATTLCPSRARPSAIARPKPRNPPVTIATRCSIDPPLEFTRRWGDSEIRVTSLSHCENLLDLREGYRLAVEGRHDFLGEGAQAGDRGAGGGEEDILDAARFEPLEPFDDLLRGAEQWRIVEHERVLVLL